jgi:hypothetical protein
LSILSTSWWTCFSFGLFVFLGLTGGILKNKVQTHNTM